MSMTRESISIIVDILIKASTLFIPCKIWIYE